MKYAKCIKELYDIKLDDLLVVIIDDCVDNIYKDNKFICDIGSPIQKEYFQIIDIKKKLLKEPLYMVMGKNEKLIKTGKGRGTVGTYDTLGSARRLKTRQGGRIIKITDYEFVDD